ncbi:hypothetical protein V8C86DRAFT_3089084 [Haematococcus lacustris]
MGQDGYEPYEVPDEDAGEHDNESGEDKDGEEDGDGDAGEGEDGDDSFGGDENGNEDEGMEGAALMLIMVVTRCWCAGCGTQGWLPRSGLLYGVDWVLYPLHPKAAHSAFSVKIMPSLKEALGQGQGQDPGQAPHPESHSSFSGAHNHMAGVEELAWHDFQITSRVAGTVAKRLLLLYLCEANTSPGLHVHQCLEHMRVEERLVQRWVPDATRD